MIKNTLILLLILFLLAGVFFMLYTTLITDDPSVVPQPQQTTLAGTYICLPLQEGSEGASSDCAVGLLADDGSYYALDLGLLFENTPQLVEGDRIEATGIITPIETLSTDYWQKYPVIGIFSATEGFELLEPDPIAEFKKQDNPIIDRQWVWQYTQEQTGKRTEAPDDSFVLSFSSDLTYTSSTDCNSLHGTFAVDGQSLRLHTPTATKMFCEGSVEALYTDSLTAVTSFAVEETQLRFTLEDSGEMVFNAQ